MFELIYCLNILYNQLHLILIDFFIHFLDIYFYLDIFKYIYMRRKLIIETYAHIFPQFLQFIKNF